MVVDQNFPFIFHRANYTHNTTSPYFFTFFYLSIYSLNKTPSPYFPLPLFLPPWRRLCFCQTLFVCLFVCLCVSKITQKVMDGSFWNFEGMSGMAKTTSYSILGVIRIKGILDSGSLWNFCYHCFQWGIGKPPQNWRWCCHLANNIALAEICGLWLLSSLIYILHKTPPLFFLLFSYFLSTFLTKLFPLFFNFPSIFTFFLFFNLHF